MPRKGESLKIKVRDEGVKTGKRRLQIEVIGDKDLFLSSDTFANRGSIPSLTELLKNSTTSEINNYFVKGAKMMDLVDKIARENREELGGEGK